jgi:hypothetical protein
MAGPFYFAWVAAGTAFVELDHATDVDEIDGITFRIRHVEDILGSFALLEVTMRNPRIGPLAPGREQWAWFSWDTGSGIVPLFFGRLRAVPDNMHQEEVTFTFRARPSDYDAQKLALATTLKAEGAPYWDRVWIAEERWDEPDAALDARAAAWHIDRVTHDVTISDFNSGEDGTIDLTGDDVFIDGVNIEPGQPPIREINVTGEVGWQQRAVGSVDLTQTLIDAFKDAGTSANYKISSYTGEALERLWPEDGRRIGAGWAVGESSLTRADGDGIAEAFFSLITMYPSIITNSGTQILYDRPEVQFPLWRFWPVLNITYAAERTFTEIVTFTLTADVQAIDTEADEQPPETLVFASAHVGEPVEPADSDNPDGVTPLGDLRRRSYFTTNRGKESLQWLIARARRDILLRARAVEVTAETDLLTGIDFSLRKNATVSDERIPGGEATGKIIAYELYGDTNSGQFGATVKLGCTIGQGNTVSAVAGTPDYAEEGVFEPGIQTYSGATIMPIPGSVTYDDFTVEPNDDGVNFFGMTPAHVLIPDSDGNLITVNGGQNEQEAILDVAFYNDKKHVEAALNTIYTEFCINLVPLNTGPFETAVPVTVSQLMVPKTYDTEAASSA